MSFGLRQQFFKIISPFYLCSYYFPSFCPNFFTFFIISSTLSSDLSTEVFKFMLQFLKNVGGIFFYKMAPYSNVIPLLSSLNFLRILISVKVFFCSLFLLTAFISPSSFSHLLCCVSDCAWASLGPSSQIMIFLRVGAIIISALLLKLPGVFSYTHQVLKKYSLK